MAKKKHAKFSDDVTNNIAKKYGDIIKKGTEVLEVIKEKQVLSFSPAMDIVLNGGIREGTVVGLAGPPKTGKTTSILHFAAKCQKEGRLVVYLNTEGRLNSQNFDGIPDLDIESLVIVESTPEKITSGETFLSIAERYITELPGTVIIIDSLSSLIPEHELNADLDAQMRNKLPKLLSMFFKRIGHHVANNNIILVCIAHMIADTSGQSRRTKMADCGNMLQYQVGTNIEITHKSDWITADKQSVGQEIHWKILTTNTGGIPNSKTSGWIRYGIGIDEIKELCDICTEFSLIKSAGAWYTMTHLIDNVENSVIKSYLEKNNVDTSKPEDVEKAFKFQGMAKMTKFLEENKDISKFLTSELKTML